MSSKIVLRVIVLLALSFYLEGARPRDRKPREINDLKEQSATIEYESESQNIGLKSRIERPYPVMINSDLLYDYFGIVALGNQPFNMLFSTEESQNWVPSIDCDAYDCGPLNRFDANLSSTYHQGGAVCKIRSGVTDGSGRLGRDDLQLAGVKISKQSFCEITDLTIGGPFGQIYDGVIGLGLSGSKTLIQNMVDQKLIEKPLFSYYLNTNLKAFPSGQLILGRVEEQLFEGPLHYVPVSNSSNWQITVDGFNLGEDFNFDLSFEAIISTRSSFIEGPFEAIIGINEVLGFERTTPEYFGAFDCDLSKFSNVTFVIGGKNYTITPDQFVLMYPEEYTGVACTSAFKLNNPFPQPVDDPWIFGSAFLGKFYSVFDQGNKRVGFAPMVKDFWLTA